MGFLSGFSKVRFEEKYGQKGPFQDPSKAELERCNFNLLRICAHKTSRPLVIIGPFYYKKSQFSLEIQSPTITGHFSFFTAFYYEVEQESVFTRSIFIEP